MREYLQPAPSTVLATVASFSSATAASGNTAAAAPSPPEPALTLRLARVRSPVIENFFGEPGAEAAGSFALAEPLHALSGSTDRCSAGGEGASPATSVSVTCSDDDASLPPAFAGACSSARSSVVVSWIFVSASRIFFAADSAVSAICARGVTREGRAHSCGSRARGVLEMVWRSHGQHALASEKG